MDTHSQHVNVLHHKEGSSGSTATAQKEIGRRMWGRYRGIAGKSHTKIMFQLSKSLRVWGWTHSIIFLENENHIARAVANDLWSHVETQPGPSVYPHPGT